MSDTIDLSERRPQYRVWLVVVGWAAAAAILALILRAQLGLPLSYTFASSAFNYGVLGALVWLACRANARYHVSRQPPLRALSVHVGLGLMAVTIWTAMQVGYMRVTIGPDYWPRVYAETWMFQLLQGAITYAASLGLGLAVQSFDRERERQRRESQLELAAREAELSAIKAQLRPHFLLNSLNSILVLIDHEPAEARTMVTRLASLLHSVFDQLDEPLVPLDREIETVRDYLEIECIRFGARLRFTICVDPDAREALVPPFLLQPLVENAVKHGIEPYVRPGEVRVTAHKDGANLRVAIADTGAGPNGTGPSTTARGLELTRRRLTSVYGEGAASIQTAHDIGGFRVDLELPVKPNVH